MLFLQLIHSVVFYVTRHQPIVWLHLSVYKPYTTRNPLICSNKGLTLEKSAFESLYGGQFTLSTKLIKANYFVTLPTDAAPVSLETYPLYSFAFING